NQYQTIARRVDQLLILFIVLAIVCFILAIVLSLHRRRTLIALGLAIAGTLVLAGILLRTVLHNVVEGIQSPGAKSAAQDVLPIMGHNLKVVGAIVLWPAILLALVAYLAGKPRWLMAAGRGAKRIGVRDREGSALAGFVAGHYEALVGVA